jgi:hypothetical protein
MAAVLAAEPAVASHWSAGWLWGLLRTEPSRFDVTSRRRRRGKREFIVHFGSLSQADVTRRERVPVTSMARTLLDLAPLVSPRRLARFLDRLEDTHDFDLRPIEALLDRGAGHRGGPPLRAALLTYQPKTRVLRSELERRFLALVEAAGLPLPATNFNVGAYEIDCWWDDERFAVELDVFATHGSRLAFEDDRERADDLLALGVEMVRVTDVRLAREPEAVMARLAAHLRRRRPARIAAGRHWSTGHQAGSHPDHE